MPEIYLYFQSTCSQLVQDLKGISRKKGNAFGLFSQRKYFYNIDFNNNRISYFICSRVVTTLKYVPYLVEQQK